MGMSVNIHLSDGYIVTKYVGPANPANSSFRTRVQITTRDGNLSFSAEEWTDFCEWMRTISCIWHGDDPCDNNITPSI